MDDYKYLEISKPELEYRIMIALEKIAKSLENYDREDEPQSEQQTKRPWGMYIIEHPMYE